MLIKAKDIKRKTLLAVGRDFATISLNIDNGSVKTTIAVPARKRGTKYEIGKVKGYEFDDDVKCSLFDSLDGIAEANV